MHKKSKLELIDKTKVISKNPQNEMEKKHFEEAPSSEDKI